MDSFDAALQRDIAVTNALREALGPDIRLMVDGNKAYSERPLAAADYAEAVKQSNIYFMEEMFPETDTDRLIELKAKLRTAGISVKLAAGESHSGGIPDEIYARRVKTSRGDEPLLDVEQADMNAHGFLQLRAKAAKQAALGMTMAPHNFGSKMGFYASRPTGKFPRSMTHSSQPCRRRESCSATESLGSPASRASESPSRRNPWRSPRWT